MAEDTTGLPAGSFHKADPSPDPLFYAHPRFVTHIDEAAIATVTVLYRRLLPAGGQILDLMTSWVSHLPPEVAYGAVTGHGLNEAELAANPRLDSWFVQDLNDNATLPLASAAYDAACMCVSVQYLQHPVRLFAQVRRVLRPGAPFVVTFSNRCFPSKAVALWLALNGAARQDLVALYCTRAGFTAIETSTTAQPGCDPLWAVIGHAPPAADED
jgi:SAM-dependent methyltransferase